MLLVLADGRLLSPRPTTALGVVEEERRLMIPSMGLGVRGGPSLLPQYKNNEDGRPMACL